MIEMPAADARAESMTSGWARRPAWREYTTASEIR